MAFILGHISMALTPLSILFSSRVKIFPTVLSLEREFGTREHTDSDKSEISAKPTFYNPPTVVSL